jgi:hypothetical protein
MHKLVDLFVSYFVPFLSVAEPRQESVRASCSSTVHRSPVDFITCINKCFSPGHLFKQSPHTLGA